MKEMVMTHLYYGILCNNSKKVVTYGLYATASRHSKWKEYFQNQIIYLNTVKTTPFMLIVNMHVSHSERYEKTSSTLMKVSLLIYERDSEGIFA